MDITFLRENNFAASYNVNRIRYLSMSTLGLDSFNVNSISMIGKSEILALGIENYGIILYHILEYRVLKLISLQEHQALHT